VVDLFNEGVDIPLVSRVVMLRPTESKIVFLQQFGRGLRSAAGKTRLEVIDFVGNYRVFASRLMHLFALVPAAGDSAEATNCHAFLKAFLADTPPVLPPGCLVDVDLEAKDLLARLVGTGGDVAVAGYRVLRTDLGRRPTPTEVLHAGYKPLVVSARHDHWFDCCSSEGDLAADEQAAPTKFSSWFTMLQRTQLAKSYKMVVLRVLLDRDAAWDGMGIDDLAAASRRFLSRTPPSAPISPARPRRPPPSPPTGSNGRSRGGWPSNPAAAGSPVRVIASGRRLRARPSSVRPSNRLWPSNGLLFGNRKPKARAEPGSVACPCTPGSRTGLRRCCSAQVRRCCTTIAFGTIPKQGRFATGP
jgi:hypothetical protein